MEGLFLRIAALSLTCSAVLLPLLLLSRRIHHRYAAKTCYFLWLLLALRLLLPFQMSLPAPAVTVEPPVYHVTMSWPPAVINSDMLVTNMAVSAVETAIPVTTASVTQILSIIWLAGGTAFLVWQSVFYLTARRSLLRRSERAGQDAAALMDALRGELRVRRLVELRCVPGLSTPMMLGLFRPVVLLPKQTMEREALSMVLRHELTHLRRRDVAYKTLLLLANGVHWFNPLAWWMVREGSRNLELCCDDDVVRGQDADFRRLYGALLIHTAAGHMAPALSTCFGSGKTQMKERLKNLFSKKKNSAVLVCVIAAAVILASSLVVCQASGKEDIFSRFDEQSRQQDEQRAAGLAELQNSITWENETLSFTIPADYAPPEGWNIHIAGRAEFDGGMSMSLHYLDGETWEAGKTYSLDIAPELWPDITELTMDAVWGEMTRYIDLLARCSAGTAPAPVYYNETYGFILQLPDSWAEYGKITEISPAEVEFSFADYDAPYGGIATLYVEAVSREDITARTHFLGMKQGCYVYLSFVQTMWPEEDALNFPEKIENYSKLYEDLENLTETALH